MLSFSDYKLLKIKLLAHCQNYLADRIMTARNAMENAQKAANEEGKSSAGDKYETTRAMMQIERDNAAKQWDAATQTKNALSQINIESKNDRVESGSLVFTSKANYFLSVSIGLIKIEDDDFMAISPLSPIGQLLLGKKQNEVFRFNGEEVMIKEIF